MSTTGVISLSLRARVRGATRATPTHEKSTRLLNRLTATL